MKPQLFRAFSTLVILITLAVALSVNAQTRSADMMTVNIPFDFSVGERRFPAGKYTVKRISQTCGCFFIQSEEGHATATISTRTTVRADEKQIQPSLVFNGYEGQYFLSRIWLADSNVGSELPKQRAERALAMNAVRPQSVVLLFKR